ncbi:MAG: hypothetical protein OJF49_003817 [Ktedonobacterales bacterium]|jgi:hypothetical protein|nr:MAG: hypothetical protein OJF49_003817 [Ktedonobacterales bacterium]
MAGGNVFTDLFTEGIGPVFVARDAPLLYHLLLGAVALALIFAVKEIFVTPDRHLPLGKRALVESGMLLGQFVFIYCIWLAYATPYSRLFGLPDSGAWGVVAICVHGLLSLVGVVGLALLWMVQTHVTVVGRWYAVALLVTVAAMVVGWEAHSWPGLYLVLCETALVYLVVWLVPAIVFDAKEVFDLNKPWSGGQYALKSVLTVGLLALIALLHAPGVYIANLLVVFLMLATFDDVALSVLSLVTKKLPQVVGSDTTWPSERWRVTALVVVAIGVAGALGVFHGVGLNPGLGATLWIEASVAAAVYLIFAPLVNRARIEAWPELVKLVQGIVQSESPHGGGWVGDAVRWVTRRLNGTPNPKPEEIATQLVQDLPVASLLFFVVILCFDLLVAHAGLSVGVAGIWANRVSWGLSIVAGQLPFLLLTKHEREIKDKLRGAFHPLTTFMRAVLSVIPFVATLFLLEAPNGTTLDLRTLPLVSKLDSSAVEKALGTIGAEAAVVVVAGYVLYLLMIWRMRWDLSRVRKKIHAGQKV